MKHREGLGWRLHVLRLQFHVHRVAVHKLPFALEEPDFVEGWELLLELRHDLGQCCVGFYFQV